MNPFSKKTLPKSKIYRQSLFKGKRTAWFGLPLLMMLIFNTSCGAVQSIKDGTTAVAEAVFIASVDTLRIDLITRAAINSDDRQQPLSVLVRIYQLSDKKNFVSNDYQTLFDSDQQKLGSDILELKEVIMAPGGTVSLNETMNKETKYVAVAAFFRDVKGEAWRLVIDRDDLSNSNPLKIELINYQLNVLLTH